MEDEDETDEERVFLISDELEFRSGETDGEPNFLWRDLEGDIDEFYEYVASGTNSHTQAFFETCMYRAMYERKYKRDADNARESDLAQFVWTPPPSRAKPNPRRKVSPRADPAALSSAMQSLSVTDPSPPTTPGKAPSGSKNQTSEAKAHVPVSKSQSIMSTMPVIAEQEAELYLWDFPNMDFINQGIVTAKIQQQEGSYIFWLVASIDDTPLLAHKICSDMNQRWSHKMFSLTWNHVDDDGSQNSWLFKFPTRTEYDAMLQSFTQCLWESLHKTPWGKVKPDERAYVLSSTEDVEMKDISEEDQDEDDEDEVFSELDPDEEASDSDLEEEDDEVPALPAGDRNSQLTVGYKGDRSYVVRGSNIGVFSHSADAGVKYYATISKISTPSGVEFKPQQVMLHEQDTKMVLKNPNDSNSLFSMDIERGKVVEEWKVHDDITVDHIAPDTKFAPTTREQTLVGASHNALFRIDPRISGTKMVESQFKQYVSKNKFSGVATTAAGKLAVASEKGDIRLFDTIGKNAKTALPPLGDPILGIDVTADGRWIVATTKTYLLLIDTLIGEGRYQGSLGFDRSFPATSKPIPRRLQLKGEHVAYMGHNISFTPAKFNQGEGQEENAIVTSTGQFVIAWDFAKVKRGLLDRYEIKKYEDYVVQDNFKFGDDKEIIVALQNNVLAINKKNLKKPNRQSLAPGNLRSHSNIVNSPY
ncbi:VID27 cytoplasmic protein [Infundibulicybe gibba]|nr:VID27 cytoplasmic protein [Infundibulicybe gibba]